MSASDTFTAWLNEQLKALNTDESVFGAYIIGILEGDETHEEKAEGIRDILSEIVDSNPEETIEAILKKWLECHPQAQEPAKKGLSSIDVNVQLAKLLEVQKIQTTIKERQYTEEERRIRQNILAQYSQTECEDVDAYPTDDEEEEKEKKPTNGMTGIERNTNAHDVMQLQKDRREQARQDSAAKKQKDKEDREKQKQMREEKKEKRKTVKGERRR